MTVIEILISFSMNTLTNYHQKSNAYLEFDITFRKNGGNSNNNDGKIKVDEPTRLVKIALAYVFSIAMLSTRGVKNMNRKLVSHVSTIMILLTSKNGDLKTYLDKIDETQMGLMAQHSIKYLLIIMKK